jgi:Cdc6-like AAA superfamily ATPase
MKTFEDFYQNLGFTAYPFTTYTTEQEKEIASDLFVPMTEYGPIIESFKRMTSYIILGERGVGKTAVVEEFFRNIDNKRIYVQLNTFDELSLEPTKEEIYSVLISRLTIALVKYIELHPVKAMHLSKSDRIYISYLVYYFSNQTTSISLKETIEHLQMPIHVRFLTLVFNRFLRAPLNYMGTVLENGIKRWIAQSLNMVPFYDATSIHQFFPEVELSTDTGFIENKVSLTIIERIADISLKLSHFKCTVIIDRIDEDSRIENDAEKTASFIHSLLTDNNLFSLDKIQIVCSLWKTPFRYIEDEVRSQKFYCPSLKWSENDLIKVLNKRLEYFSNGKIRDYKELFEKDSLDILKEAIALTNGIPRDLWHLLGKIFEEQVSINSDSHFIESHSIKSAMERFVTEFNYYEYYPRRSTSRADSMDIYSYYAHLLKVKTSEFTKNKLNELAGTGSSTSNYVTGMERIGLIERVRQNRGQIIYQIHDNKIIFAIKNNLDIRKK